MNFAASTATRFGTTGLERGSTGMGDAAQQYGGAAAGAGCAAEVGPEAAPLCSYAAGVVIGAIEDLFGTPSASWNAPPAVRFMYWLPSPEVTRKLCKDPVVGAWIALQKDGPPGFGGFISGFPYKNIGDVPNVPMGESPLNLAQGWQSFLYLQCAAGKLAGPVGPTSTVQDLVANAKPHIHIPQQSPHIHIPQSPHEPMTTAAKVAIGSGVVVVAGAAAFFGWRLYQGLPLIPGI